MSENMTSLEFGPLIGIKIMIEAKHEKSARYALARLLAQLAQGDRQAVAHILRHEVEGVAMWKVLSVAMENLRREGVYTREEVVDLVAKAVKKLGKRDEAESEELSQPGRQVIAWESGEILAFEKAEGGWVDVTDVVVDELDSEKDSQRSLFGAAPGLVEEFEESMIRDSPEKTQEGIMCSLCAQTIQEGVPHGIWEDSSGTPTTHPAHLGCVEQENARRGSRGVYGTAKEMRDELVKRGQSVGEQWDPDELSRRVLSARRDQDEIKWNDYDKRKAIRKQGRECLLCGDPIIKGDGYRQASRGRKAHERCLGAGTPAT